MFVGCPEVKNGYMLAQEKPGLGIEVDEKLAAKFPFPPGPPNFDYSWDKEHTEELAGHDNQGEKKYHSGGQKRGGKAIIWCRTPLTGKKKNKRKGKRSRNRPWPAWGDPFGSGAARPPRA